MTPGHALAAFAVAAGILTITPGLDTALVLRTAAVAGRREAAMAAFGVCLGCLFWGVSAAAGLGVLLTASTLAYDLLRAAGAGYLIFLGTRLLLYPRGASQALAADPGVCAQPRPDAPARWFLRGLLTNLLNPKVGVFYVTFLPLFVPAGVNVAWFSVLLTSVHVGQGALWFALLIAATRPLERWLQRPGIVRALDRGTGLVFVGFGLRLAWDRGR